MLNTERFKGFVALYKKKQRLTAELKEVDEKIGAMNTALVDNLLDNDMSKISIAGKTCYIKTRRFAKLSNKQETMSTLREAGYGDYIKEGYNKQSIDKLVRDLHDENGALPEEFGDVIQLDSTSIIGVTNG